MRQERENQPSPRRWPLAVAIAAVALVVRLPLLASPGFVPDQTQFVYWSVLSHSPEGMAAVYAQRTSEGRPVCNYPPIGVYLLKGLGEVYELLSPSEEGLDPSLVQAVVGGESTPATRRAVTLYKLPAVLADALLGALLFLFLAARYPLRSAALVAGCYVLMPAVIYNSAVWGQVDALPTLLVIVSLELARRGRTGWMVAVATLAILTKAQAAAMAPLWLGVAVYWTLRPTGQTVLRTAASGRDSRASRKRAARAAVQGRPGLRRMAGRWVMLLAIVALVAIVVLIPFRRELHGVWQAYAGATSFYPFTHLNGFSAWFLSAPLREPHLGSVPLADWYVLDSTSVFLGLSSRSWGMIGVLAVWGLVLEMLWRRRCDDRALCWAARTLPLAFFVLSTQMHERYLFQALAIWAWSFLPCRRWWLCWLVVCGAAAVNIFWAWPGPGEGAWGTGVAQMLHRTWLWLTPGVWCGGALIIVLALSTIGWIDGLSWRAKQTPSTSDTGA